MRNVNTNVISVIVGAEKPVRHIEIVLHNGEDKYFYAMRNSSDIANVNMDIGLLVKGASGWKFYPCQKEFVV